MTRSRHAALRISGGITALAARCFLPRAGEDAQPARELLGEEGSGLGGDGGGVRTCACTPLRAMIPAKLKNRIKIAYKYVDDESS